MDKEEQLAKTILLIKKQFGEGAIFKLGDMPLADEDVISTGSLAIDLAIGIGGLPRGRIVEVYGPESSGKTTLCQHVIAEAQKAGGHCAFVDMEHALDPTYAAKCGVDVDALYISQPDSGEQALGIVQALVDSGSVDVIVVDSVAALTPRAELEGEMGDVHVGLQARLMSQAMRKLSGPLKRSNTLLIFTNQIRMKIGVMFGSPEVTSGGRALKFYASIILDMRPRVEKSGGEAVANKVRVRVKKNKVAPPFQEAEVYLRFGTGFVKAYDLLTLGIQHELIKKSGAYYYFSEEQKAHGEDAAIAFLEENTTVAAEIEAQLRNIVLPKRDK